MNILIDPKRTISYRCLLAELNVWTSGSLGSSRSDLVSSVSHQYILRTWELSISALWHKHYLCFCWTLQFDDNNMVIPLALTFVSNFLIYSSVSAGYFWAAYRTMYCQMYRALSLSSKIQTSSADRSAVLMIHTEALGFKRIQTS